MPKFSYTAVDARGKQANGFVEAHDQNDAITQIRQLGFYPQRLDEAKEEDVVAGTDTKTVVKKGGGKVKSKVLTIFTRQLATLIEAGLPLMRSLNTLAKQERNPVMKSTMAQLASAVGKRRHVFRGAGPAPAHLRQTLRQHGQGGRIGRRA